MAKGQSSASGRLPTSAATTNATLASAAPCDLYHITAMNTTASVKYLKLYNKKSTPVVGTDVPVMTIALAPSNALTNIPIDLGLYFNLGLGFATTGLAADADTTAVAAGDIVGVNLLYT